MDENRYENERVRQNEEKGKVRESLRNKGDVHTAQKISEHARKAYQEERKKKQKERDKPTSAEYDRQ